MTIDIQTHELINKALCGSPLENGNGVSRVKLTITSEMKVDRRELSHGGFIFGLADHAAMIAVNHPNVVLGAADVRFLKPTVTGDTLIARAEVITEEGKKSKVVVTVSREDEAVFEGEFICFALDQHVLD